MKRKKQSKKVMSVALAACLAAGSMALANPVLAEEDSFAAAMKEKFAESEMKYRPYARWWLAEGSHTDTTLKESIKELYDAGYGGVEFVTLTSEAEYLDDATYGWGSPEWIHDSKLIISECAKYGMSVSMTGGTYWATANLTNITPDMQEASQELGYSAQEMKGTAGTNTAFSGALPVCELPEDSTVKELVSVVVAGVASWEDEDGKVQIDSNNLTVVPKESITDNGDGTWSAEYEAEDDGDYMLFAFYQYGTGESYAAASTGKSYTINYLDPVGANALIAYWDENVLTEDLQSVIDSIDECNLYMDSLELATEGPESTNQLWSQGMLSEFEGRRGYDLEKYLPMMIRSTGTAISGMGQEIQYTYDFTETENVNITDLRSDFFQTQTELYEENCLSILSDWLHSKNMKLRAEPSYGKTLEVTQTVDQLDYLETESFEFGSELDLYRNFSGAAHVYNKRLSSETGASIFTNYLWNSGYYRQIMYTQYAAGIQKTVTHGYSSEYGPDESVVWPGYEGMTNLIAERFNKRQPSFVDSVDVNEHLSRIQEAMEQGVPQVDIAMLRTDYNLFNIATSVSNAGANTNRLHTNEGYYWQDMELQNAGYTYEYFSPYILTDTDMSTGVVNADGVAYKAVIVMEDELPLESAKALLEGAKNGLPVLFVNNVVEDVTRGVNAEGEPEGRSFKENTIAGSVTGSNDGKDEELAAVVEEMKALDNVVTVESTEDAYEALKDLGVTPRTEFAESNAKILTNLRKDADATYLYVYNYMYEDTENYTGDISVEGIYQPYLLNTWNGDVTEVTDAQNTETNTILHVDLAPGDVAVYLLNPNGTAADTAAESTTEETQLSGWSLKVDSFTPGEKVERTETTEETGVETTEVTYSTNHVEVDAGTLDELVSWNQIEALGDQVSGIGTYDTTFTLNEDQIGGTITFKADSFNLGTAMITVNGEKAVVNMDACTADITDLVQAGENTISVRVTSSLCNVVRGYEPIFWITEETPAAEYGMVGNTVITIEK